MLACMWILYSSTFTHFNAFNLSSWVLSMYFKRFECYSTWSFMFLRPKLNIIMPNAYETVGKVIAKMIRAFYISNIPIKCNSMFSILHVRTVQGPCLLIYDSTFTSNLSDSRREVHLWITLNKSANFLTPCHTASCRCNLASILHHPAYIYAVQVMVDTNLHPPTSSWGQ